MLGFKVSLSQRPTTNNMSLKRKIEQEEPVREDDDCCHASKRSLTTIPGTVTFDDGRKITLQIRYDGDDAKDLTARDFIYRGKACAPIAKAEDPFHPSYVNKPQLFTKEDAEQALIDAREAIEKPTVYMVTKYEPSRIKFMRAMCIMLCHEYSLTYWDFLGMLDSTLQAYFNMFIQNVMCARHSFPAALDEYVTLKLMRQARWDLYEEFSKLDKKRAQEQFGQTHLIQDGETVVVDASRCKSADSSESKCTLCHDEFDKDEPQFGCLNPDCQTTFHGPCLCDFFWFKKPDQECLDCPVCKKYSLSTFYDIVPRRDAHGDQELP